MSDEMAPRCHSCGVRLVPTEHAGLALHPPDWLDRIVAEQREQMARWGYTPEMVAAAAADDPGEQGEIEQGWPR